MAHRNLSNLKQANLSINNKTLKIDRPYVVYQIPNITSVDKIIKRPGDDDIIFTIIGYSFSFSVCLVIIGLLGLAFSGNLFWLVPCVLGSATTAMFWILLKERIENQTKYGAFISTNDAKSVTIYDKDERFIEDIMSKLYQVMENQDEPVKYNFTIQGDIIQQSGNFGIGINRGRIN
jgi:hypothetical protein